MRSYCGYHTSLYLLTPKTIAPGVVLEQRTVVFLSNLRKVRHRRRRVRSKRKPILWRRRKRWLRSRRRCCHGDGSGRDFDEISPESGTVTEGSLRANAFPVNAKRVDRSADEP